MIYSPKASVVMSGIFGRDKCAANLVMAMGLRCTADFRALNHPNSSFSFPFFQRFATVGSRLCPRPETDAMSCHSSKEATEPSEMPKFAASPFQRCNCPRKDFDAFWSQFRVFVGAYTLARPSVHTCIVIFQTYGHRAFPCATFFKYREAHYPFRFSSDGELTT